MIEWVTIISLLIMGLILLIAEIMFVPGTTIVGIVGFVFLAIGIGLGFRYFGSSTGWIITGVSTVASGVILVYAFKTNVWRRFASRETIASRVNEEEMNNLAEGAEGIAISALRPIGKAELNGKVYEVKTFGNYLETGAKVKVIRIMSHEVIVEQIK